MKPEAQVLLLKHIGQKPLPILKHLQKHQKS